MVEFSLKEIERLLFRGEAVFMKFGVRLPWLFRITDRLREDNSLVRLQI